MDVEGNKFVGLIVLGRNELQAGLLRLLKMLMTTKEGWGGKGEERRAVEEGSKSKL